MQTPRGILLCSLFAIILSACGDRDSRHDILDDSHPYLTDGKYSGVIKRCATAETPVGSCSLNTLPPIGMEFPNPSIADIMGRVLVSHDWMGERFERLLEDVPNDILQLLGAVTVVVIDGDIRPSYYHNLTGAIYLDPANLWMTQQEKISINVKVDHREAYADPMAFRSYWRYSKSNGDAYQWYGLDSTHNRPFEDIIKPMASLLYHELAHANDIFPVGSYNDVDKSKSIYSVTESLYNVYPSTQLKESRPLMSQEMFHLANILFSGAAPSVSDTQITAAQVGEFFGSDRASDDYSYSSQYEDMAMLVEESMMKYHYDIDRDMGFVIPIANASNCDENKVAWGVRNRIADENVKERAQMVLQGILPNEDYSNFFASLSGPIRFPSNIGWCQSIDLSTNGVTNGLLKTQSRKAQPFQPASMNRLYKTHY